MLIPNQSKTSAVRIIESGMAVRLMTDVLKFQRKRKRTMMTRIAPSRRASNTLARAASMNSSCLNILLWNTISGGSSSCSRSRDSSTFRVSSSVSAPGCFWIARMIARRLGKIFFRIESFQVFF